MKKYEIVVEEVSEFKKKKKSRKYVFVIIEILLCLFLVFQGFNVLSPVYPDYDESNVGFACWTDGDFFDEDIEYIKISQNNSWNYESNDIELEVKIKDNIVAKGSVYIIVPYRMKLSNRNDTYERVSIEYFDEVTRAKLDFDLSKDEHIYHFYLFGNTIHRYSSDKQYFQINMAEDFEYLDFPVAYEFHSLGFTEYDIVGEKPSEDDGSKVVWNDIAKNIDYPTIVVFKNLEYSNKMELEKLKGTIILTIGLSYLVNIIFGLLRNLAKD